MSSNSTNTIAIGSAVRKDGAFCTITGVPQELTIDQDYLAHQAFRYLQRLTGVSAAVPKPSIVFKSGFSSGRVRNSTVRLRVDFGGRLYPTKLKRTATEIVGATFARKYLEDNGIFIGSHTVEFGSGRVDESELTKRKSEFLKASCGAYKITEQADKFPLRTLSDAGSGVVAIESIQKIVAEIVVSRRPSAPSIDSQMLLSKIAQRSSELPGCWGVFFCSTESTVSGGNNSIALEFRLKGEKLNELLSSAILAESLVSNSLYDAVGSTLPNTASRS